MMEGMGKGDREAMEGRRRLPLGRTVGHWGRHPGKAEDSELRPPPPTPQSGFRLEDPPVQRPGLGDPPAWRHGLGVCWPGGTHLHTGLAWGYPGLRGGVSHMYRGLGWGQGALRR